MENNIINSCLEEENKLWLNKEKEKLPLEGRPEPKEGPRHPEGRPEPKEGPRHLEGRPEPKEGPRHPEGRPEPKEGPRYL